MPRQPKAPDMNAAQRRAALEAMREADRLIQDFRAAYVKLTFNLAFREDLDPLRREMEKLEGWRLWTRALERSPTALAAVAAFTRPDDEVRVP